MSVFVRCAGSAHVDSRVLIEAIAGRVRDFLDGESSGHDWEHTRRVWESAKAIGTAEGADMRLVELAALLHDVDDWKINGGKPGETTQKNTRAFLEKAGADEDLTKSVCRIIASIDYRGAVVQTTVKTLEDKVVHDADKLDAIGAIGIARCFTFNGKIGQALFLPDVPPCMDIDETHYADIGRRENTAINHFFEKLLRLKDRMYTETGRQMALPRHETMLGFLKTFFREQGLVEWGARLAMFSENASGAASDPAAVS